MNKAKNNKKDNRQKIKTDPKPKNIPVNLNLVLPVSIGVLVFACFSYSLQNKFLNWDDWIYMDSIKDITPKRFIDLLIGNPTRNYYHPITMLSLYANYLLFKLTPAPYYLTNILIHITNCILVYFLVKKIIEDLIATGFTQVTTIPWIAAATALWYGVAPMHVESVSWIAERKDVLYASFYFLGLIYYVRYIKEKKRKWMIYVIILYACSLLSKPMAVAFPLSLFAFDYLFNRISRSNLKGDILLLLKEKIPFFIVSLLAGILVFFTQAQSNSIAFLHGYSIPDKFMIACYGFEMYSFKAIFPVDLSGYYPYPPLLSDYSLPSKYHYAPLGAAAIVLIPLYLSYYANKNFFRIVAFGLMFYFFNLMFVLQFVSSGTTIMSERYSYVAYFGLIFFVTFLLMYLAGKVKVLKFLYFIIGAQLVIYSYLCYQRTKVWHDPVTFWGDAILKHPDESELPYLNLGDYASSLTPVDTAITFRCYSKLESFHAKYPQVYRNLGNIYAMRNQYQRSLKEYALALRYDTSGGSDTYLDMAVTFSIMHELDSAIFYYDKSYKKDSTTDKVIINRAYALLEAKQYRRAIKDYSRLIHLDSANSMYYSQRGIAEYNAGSIDSSIRDYLKYIKMAPDNKDVPQFMYNLSLAYNSLKDYSNAYKYAMKAKNKGFNISDDYLIPLQRKSH